MEDGSQHKIDEERIKENIFLLSLTMLDRAFISQVIGLSVMEEEKNKLI